MKFRGKKLSKIALKSKRETREINTNIRKLGREGHTPCQL
jgi:hypothetical protein